MTTLLKGEEFAEALANDSVIAPVALIGLVKPAKDRADILFAPEIGPLTTPGTLCDALLWIRIPVDIIDSVEVLEKIPCREKTYDHVRLILKQEIGGPVGNALLALLHNYIGAAKQSIKSSVSPNIPSYSTPVLQIGPGGAQEQVQAPTALAYYWFMLTNPSSEINPCFTVQVVAENYQQAYQMAQNQATNYKVTPITYQQYLQGC